MEKPPELEHAPQGKCESDADYMMRRTWAGRQHQTAVAMWEAQKTFEARRATLVHAIGEDATAALIGLIETATKTTRK